MWTITSAMSGYSARSRSSTSLARACASASVLASRGRGSRTRRAPRPSGARRSRVAVCLRLRSRSARLRPARARRRRCASASGSRCVCTDEISGTAAMIARSTSSAIACASSSGSSPGSFRCSDSSVAPSSVTRLRLWISRTRGDAERGGVGSLAQRLLARLGLDVDDHVAARQRALDCAPRRGRRRRAPARPPPLGDRDHDVGEVPPGRLPQPEP